MPIAMATDSVPQSSKSSPNNSRVSVSNRTIAKGYRQLGPATQPKNTNHQRGTAPVGKVVRFEFYGRYIQLPTPRCFAVRIFFFPASRCSSRLKPRRLPGSLLGQLSGAQRGNLAKVSKRWRSMPKASRRQQRSQGGWRIEEDFSTPTLNRQHAVVVTDEEAHPCNPCSTARPKGHIPCWLQRLKIFIGLEKGFDAQGIENPEGNQEQQDISGCGRLPGPFKSTSAGTLSFTLIICVCIKLVRFRDRRLSRR